MMKLLIADDEAFIRQGIKNAIPWQKHDIEVVGEASNGKEALKLALQLQPDIVLADIQMPVMTGLELARQLQQLLPETKVIILSAYGSTENFTSAIETKVSRFVLKNASSSDILTNVLQVCEEIHKEQDSYHSYANLNDVYNENQHLIQSTLLIRYLTRQLSLRDFESKLQKAQIDLSGPFYAMLLADCYNVDDWLSVSAFKNAFSSYRPFAFFMKDKQLILLLNTDSIGVTEAVMKQILPEIKPYIYTGQLALLNGIEAFSEFPIAYDSLINCLDYCFWNTETEYTLITPSYPLHSTESSELPQKEKEIISAILSGSKKAMEDALSDYYDFCKSTPVSKSVFLDSARRLLLLISAVRSTETDMDPGADYLYELETPYEIIEYLKSLILPDTFLRSQMPQITDALAYIDAHYDEELRLEDVAKEISLSVGYLSRIFKAETGYSFKEWINRVRIEKAKELIATTNLKYYEIAEQVGYKDYKYFAAYFNRFCGCSAKEYKNKKR